VSGARLYPLFFCSGASGLIYQIVWVREFGNVFGNTIHSASLVIAVFMCGLGVGSYLAGVWADRRYAAGQDVLLHAYGFAELAIAILGIGISLLLPQLGAVSAAISSYTRAPNGWYELSTASYLARYAIAVVLLTPITVAMGGTLTLLIRHLVRRDLAVAGRRIGALYAANTAGAALGCFLTDQALIPLGGLHVAQFLAVFLNLIAALGAFRLAAASSAAGTAREAAGSPPIGPVSAASSRGSREVILMAVSVGMAGFAAMGMEIVWFRHMSALFGSFRAVISLILTVILAGICLGALAGSYLKLQMRGGALLYVAAQSLFVIAALVGLAQADIRRILADLEAGAFGVFAATGWRREMLLLQLSLAPVLREVAVPALLMGFTFPLANVAIQHVERAVGRRAGVLYLANTVGAVAGALAAGFVLLPGLGLQRSVTVLALAGVAGVLACAAAFVAVSSRAARAGFATAVGAVIAATVIWITLPAGYVIDHMSWPLRPGERQLTVKEGLNEVVSVVEMPGEGRRLMTNSHSMSATDPSSQRYMRAFAHIPLLAMPNPDSALVICFGVGNTLHAASLHPTLRRLEVVDLSKEVLRHAGWFADTNGGVLDSARVAVYVNDGRHHLRMQAPSTYDLVTMEPPPIAFAGVASLYSREFYQLVRRRLKPGGAITQWLPAYQVPGEGTLAIVRAFVEVFPQAVLLSGSNAELILMGVNGPRIEIDPEVVAARLRASPAVAEDLRKISLGTLTELIGTFAAPGDRLASVSEPYAAVTDDYPIIEYLVSSRLRGQRIPEELFDPRAFALWCPRCFVDGRPAPAVARLPAYLAILAGVYRGTSFLESSWPPRPQTVSPLRVALEPETVQAAIGESPYLQRLFAPPAGH
jgi:spermidine synthase